MVTKVDKNSYFDDDSGCFINKVGKSWDVYKESTDKVLGTYKTRAMAIQMLPELSNYVPCYLMCI